MPPSPRALTPEEIQEAIRALLARHAASIGLLAVGATVTGVLAKYDGDLIRCPACAGVGHYERPGQDDNLPDTLLCVECEGRGHLNGEPVELLRVVNGKLVEHLVQGQSMPVPSQED